MRFGRTRTHGLASPALALLFLIPLHAALADPAHDGCSLLPMPDVPVLGRAPNIAVWPGDAIAAFQQKRCGASEVDPESAWILGVATFQHVGAVQELLAPFAAVSNYQNIRRGADDGTRNPLIADAYALRRPDGGKRGDFALAELTVGTPRYLSITTAGTGSITYRMIVTELQQHRVALVIDNVTPVRFAGMVALREGASRFSWTFEPQRLDVWRITVVYQLSSPLRQLLRSQTADGPVWIEALLRYFSEPLTVALKARPGP